MKIINTNSNTSILNVSNINFNIDGIVIDETTLKNKLPLSYKNYTFNCDSLYHQPNKFYHLKTGKINTTNTSLKVNQFQLIPKDGRREFSNKTEKEKDLFTVFSKEINIKNLNWGFNSKVLFINAELLQLQEVDANVYRNKLPEDDLTKKNLYNKLLRDLKFNLKIDTLKIQNSILTYEEEKSFEKGPSKLTFNNFNLTATSISSGFNHEKVSDLKINIDCKFMNVSPLKISWTFNILDKKTDLTLKEDF